jgi:hypothetical protein
MIPTIPTIPPIPPILTISDDPGDLRDRDRAAASRRPRTNLHTRRAGSESFAAARPDHQR